MATQIYTTVREFARALIAIGKTIGNLINQALQAGLTLLRKMVQALVELGRAVRRAARGGCPLRRRRLSVPSSRRCACSGRRSRS